jgi:hypothetical protein
VHSGADAEGRGLLEASLAQLEAALGVEHELTARARARLTSASAGRSK